MPTTDDTKPNRPDPAHTAARIGELLRLHLFLDQPDLDLAAVRAYVADRLQRLYPLDYHVYRRRWHDRGERRGRGRSCRFWSGGRWCRSWKNGRLSVSHQKQGTSTGKVRRQPGATDSL